MGSRMTKIPTIEFIVQQSTSALHLSTDTQQLSAFAARSVFLLVITNTAARQSFPPKLKPGTVRVGGTV